MPRRRRSPGRGLLAAVALALSGLMPPSSGAAPAEPLVLDVVLNGLPAGNTTEFLRAPDGRLAIRAGALAALGIAAPTTGAPGEAVPLDAVPGLRHRHDAAARSIEIDVPPAALGRHLFSASEPDPDRPPPESAPGAVLAYDLFASAARDGLGGMGFSGASLRLDGRAFGEWGLLRSGLVLGTTPGSDAAAIRLGTTYSRSFTGRGATARAGDLISGGLAWTRPIRMGGVQLERDFALRPDLITTPLPSFEGSAAVPSTIDVFVGEVRTYSREVPGGEFTLRDVPVLTGAGTARMVVTDVTGRESVTTTPFVAFPELLARGLFDFSAEMGVARLGFGTPGDRYDAAPVASGSLRYGLTGRLTLEGHAEAGGGLLNAGLGAVGTLGRLGTYSVAQSVSRAPGGWGGRLYAAADLDWGAVALQASTRRAFGAYEDLAGLTAAAMPDDHPRRFTRTGASIDSLSLGIGSPWEGAGLDFGVVRHAGDADEGSSAVATWSQRLSDRASFTLSGRSSLGGRGNVELRAGLDLDLGGWGSGRMDGGSGEPATLGLSRPWRDEPGSVSWSVRATRAEASEAEAAVAWNAGRARLDATLRHNHDGTTATLHLGGAAAATGSGLHLAHRIDAAFAVVDAGRPGVAVRHGDRRAGRTGPDGTLLVRGLRPYEANTLSVAGAPRAAVEVVPRRLGAALVAFDLGPAGPQAAEVSAGPGAEGGHGPRAGAAPIRRTTWTSDPCRAPRRCRR